MQNLLAGWHLPVLLFIILLIWGAPKLPGLARSLGQSMNIFKSEIRAGKKPEGDSTPAEPTADDAPTKN
ncbi:MULTISPECIES: twin-arginine translocase TatA/TatE family subunit [Mycetocola]|uniref:Twin-arginine translocase TatA/TatE family subunit n=1 Tax=Mycetocola lacteus TaxID=76637 RepID=A0A3L7AQ94_9MICO|nr:MULTISPECIES: twin-arginine translocase TatA/TatE family subunit [Mycetocola]MCS4277065.1 sec-independent protein translocase protein TatA [Mycetocola sp. BIGb0189]RLP82527.1 twin-arginine translocase TatA/TatE family subunit [Mycetocola lacteus]